MCVCLTLCYYSVGQVEHSPLRCQCAPFCDGKPILADWWSSRDWILGEPASCMRFYGLCAFDQLCSSVYKTHLSIQPPVYCSHLSTAATCLVQSPVYCSHLSSTVTCLVQPLFNAVIPYENISVFISIEVVLLVTIPFPYAGFEIGYLGDCTRFGSFGWIIVLL